MAYTDYIDTVQKIYIAYYGRPADPGGLRFWATELDKAGGNLDKIIDAFATSAEAEALYPDGDPAALVASVYDALFGRAPDPAGLDFYTKALNDGQFPDGRPATPGRIALDILNGAQGDDLAVIDNKVAAANLFTEIVDGRPFNDPGFGVETEDYSFAATYDDADIGAGRQFLEGVTSSPDSVPDRAAAQSFVQDSIADEGDPITEVRTFTLTASADSAEEGGSVTVFIAGGEPSTEYVLRVAQGEVVSFVPVTTDASGAASAAFDVLDNLSADTKAEVSVVGRSESVSIDLIAVNDAPALTGVPAAPGEGEEDAGFTVSAADLLAGYTDEEGDALSVANVVADNGATVAANEDGTYTITPAPDFNGVVTVSYEVTDGAASTPASWQVNFAPVNDPPVAEDAVAAVSEEDAPISGQLVATDVDGDALVFALDAPVDGLTLNEDGSWTFDPSQNPAATALTYTDDPVEIVANYTVTDAEGATDGGTLTITVTPAPLTFALVASASTVEEGSAVEYTVVASEPVQEEFSGQIQITLTESDTASLNDFGPGSFNPQAITIAAGQTTSNVVTITPLNDAVTEFPETFTATAAIPGYTIAAVQTTIQDPAGSVFTLTTGEDNLTGTPGNDTFNAPILSDAGALVATLQDFDILDGGAGTDTLNATLDGTPVAARISNIDIINLRDTTGTTVDFTDVSGVRQIWNSQSVGSATLQYDAAPISATFGVRNTASTTNINTITGTATTGNILNLAVAGAGIAGGAAAVVTSTADAALIDGGINMTATGTNNVDVSAFNAAEALTLDTTGSLELTVDGTAMTDITITGSGELDLTDAGNFAAVENVVATGFSGDLALDISGSGALESVATGTGDDTITIDGGLLVAAAAISIDLGDGENTLRLANIDDADFATLVFTGDDLTVAGVGVLSFVNTITLTNDRILDLDGIAPSAIVFEGAVDLSGGNTLELANTAASLVLTFEGGLDNGDLNLGDAAETVVINAENVVGNAHPVTVIGDALVSLTLNLEHSADINVGATEAALETVVINATGDVGATTITSTISGDPAVGSAFSLTSLTLADATDDGNTTFTIDLVDTVDLTTINLSGGVDTVFTIDASVANFAGTVTINIGDFGVDADGVVSTSANLSYTADTAGNLREVFKFVGEDFGDVTINDFLPGVGGNADRLDFSAFAGVTGLDDLNITYDGSDTVITSDAFAGEITVVGVDLSTDAVNFIF